MKVIRIVIFLLAGLFCTISAQNIPNEFIDIKEVVPSIVLDIRYFSTHNFVGQRINGYNAPKCYLTKEAANAVKNVQDELAKFSLSLKIYDGYRPQRSVNHFIEWAKNLSDTAMKREFYPNVKKMDLFKEGYIADKSSHSRGSTLDLTIVPIPVPKQEIYTPGQRLCDCTLPVNDRFRDNSLDMGTGYDCFDKLCWTENKDISIQQRTNRMLLKTLMEKHGFKNYEKEWWHYTLRNEPFPNTYFNFAIE